MKNDIKTKSTDFLPQKPGLGSTPADTSAPTSTPTTATQTVSDLPPGAPTPSKHVIDLKNANSDTANAGTSNSAPVSSNPFLKGNKSPEDLKVGPAPTPVAAEPIKTAETMPSAPAVGTEESKVPNEEKPEVETKQAQPGTAPNMDLAHPESEEPSAEKDSLKDAMVSDDATAKKPKKKLPTWLLVIIIVVVVILIGIITFAVLNAVAKPTGV